MLIFKNSFPNNIDFLFTITLRERQFYGYLICYVNWWSGLDSVGGHSTGISAKWRTSSWTPRFNDVCSIIIRRMYGVCSIMLGNIHKHCSIIQFYMVLRCTLVLHWRNTQLYWNSLLLYFYEIQIDFISFMSLDVLLTRNKTKDIFNFL